LATIVPLPDPDGVTVHQGISDTAFQVDAVVVTVKFVDPAGGVTFWFDGETIREGEVPACVTVTVTGVMPVTVTVRVAIRVEVDVLFV
jgi:hypothetical protein